MKNTSKSVNGLIGLRRVVNKKNGTVLAGFALLLGGFGAGVALGSNQALTEGSSIPLPVAKGGTGASSFPAGQALIGAGGASINTRAITDVIGSGSDSLSTAGAVRDSLGGCSEILQQSGSATGVSVNGNSYNTQYIYFPIAYKSGTVPVVSIGNYYLENGALIGVPYNMSNTNMRVGWRNLSGSALSQNSVKWSAIGCKE